MLESKFQKIVIEKLKDNGFFVGKEDSLSGIGDLLLVNKYDNGRAYSIELKTTSKLKYIQQIRLDMFNFHNAVGIVINESHDIDEFIEELKTKDHKFIRNKYKGERINVEGN